MTGGPWGTHGAGTPHLGTHPGAHPGPKPGPCQSLPGPSLPGPSLGPTSGLPSGLTSGLTSARSALSARSASSFLAPSSSRSSMPMSSSLEWGELDRRPPGVRLPLRLCHSPSQTGLDTCSRNNKGDDDSLSCEAADDYCPQFPVPTHTVPAR